MIFQLQIRQWTACGQIGVHAPRHVEVVRDFEELNVKHKMEENFVLDHSRKIVTHKNVSNVVMMESP